MRPPNAANQLPATGLYQLWIYLSRPLHRQIGRLGTIRLAPGWYVYTGSARQNLPARIARHYRKTKKLHWHIDYLLASRYAYIRLVRTRPWSPAGECHWNRQTQRRYRSAAFVNRFGSSDCHCQAHLVYMDSQIRKCT